MFVNSIYAENIDVKPKGIYGEIDISRDNQTIASFFTNDKKIKLDAIAAVLDKPNTFAPPVLYALAYVLFNSGLKADGAYYFYIAQLRARYDANRCSDSTAGNGVDELNDNYGPPINKFTFANPTILTNVVIKAIEFVSNNKEEYDQRWINLRGMQCMIYSLDNNNKKIDKDSLSYPKKDWPRIKLDTISNYYAAFDEYVKKK